MRILFPYMARWHAVNWTRYHSLLSALAEQGHEVYVLQPPSLKSAETNFQEVAPVHQDNLYIYDVPMPKWLWERHFPFDKLVKKAMYSLWSLNQARKIIAEKKIDVMVLYNIPQYFFSFIKQPVQIFDYADDYIDMLDRELGRASHPALLRLAQWLLDGMMKRADITLTVSHELGKSAIGNVQVLANGVGASKSRLGDVADVVVENHGKPVVGFIGSFEYFIDFDLIVDAASQLPDVHFLLVGYGRDWPGVKSKVETLGLKNVQLTGGVPHAQVFKYIAKMDVCLNIFKPIPVSHRACPLKLFEYISRRKSVISTRLHELNYIDDGFLFYADSASELVERINFLLSHPEEREAAVEKAYCVTMANYTWESLASRFAELVSQQKASG